VIGDAEAAEQVVVLKDLRGERPEERLPWEQLPQRLSPA
jgi:hypothetical protein